MLNVNKNLKNTHTHTHQPYLWFCASQRFKISVQQYK